MEISVAHHALGDRLLIKYINYYNQRSENLLSSPSVISCFMYYQTLLSAGPLAIELRVWPKAVHHPIHTQREMFIRIRWVAMEYFQQITGERNTTFTFSNTGGVVLSTQSSFYNESAVVSAPQSEDWTLLVYMYVACHRCVLFQWFRHQLISLAVASGMLCNLIPALTTLRIDYSPVSQALRGVLSQCGLYPHWTVIPQPYDV